MCFVVVLCSFCGYFVSVLYFFRFRLVVCFCLFSFSLLVRCRLICEGSSRLFLSSEIVSDCDAIGREGGRFGSQVGGNSPRFFLFVV